MRHHGKQRVVVFCLFLSSTCHSSSAVKIDYIKLVRILCQLELKFSWFRTNKYWRMPTIKCTEVLNISLLLNLLISFPFKFYNTVL